jgi:hypothetical protein
MLDLAALQPRLFIEPVTALTDLLHNATLTAIEHT